MFLFEIGFTEIEGIAIVVLFAFVGYLMIELKSLRRAIALKQPQTTDNSKLQLQAYERLALLTDRISLKNLISRLHSPAYNISEFKAGLIETIKGEFEHNITQQIYVNPEVWKAVINLKEQNIFIINQLAAMLPSNASATELSKMVLEYVDQNNSELSSIVLDAIQYEAKKLM